MSTRKIQRALISVYDKTGVAAFARALVEEFGIEIVSTGGTASCLKEHGVPVTLVEDVTGFPELMDGRVKTLHPNIFAAILADRNNPEHMRQLAEQGIQPIDMVVVNLYPFEETVADPGCPFERAIEMIDIGGPSLIRAAAKNHEHVLTILNPDEYETTLRLVRARDRNASRDDPYRRTARHAFEMTSDYDARVARWLSPHVPEEAPARRVISLRHAKPLRYGENPHQTAELFEDEEHPADRALTPVEAIGPGKRSEPGVAPATQAMSYNNYVDANAALEMGAELTRELRVSGDPDRNCCAAVFVKHTNACGVGLGPEPLEAYRRAYLGDPNAAMGGILACNFRVDERIAEAVMATFERWGRDAGAGGFFVEVWIASGFDERAVRLIRSTKKWGLRVRLLHVADWGATAAPGSIDVTKVTGGLLVQSRDVVGLNERQWTIVTRRSPSNGERDDLRLAWLVCKHTKSNAVTICKDHMLIGNGAGQMSRVMSCRIAAWLAKENGHGEKLAGAAAASDAFFPFRDGPDMLIKAGVTAIIQPGGSKRDEETIAACDQHGVAMIFTGTRHFKH